METKANYIITGSFTLAVVAAVFGFNFWFQHHSGSGGRNEYRTVPVRADTKVGLEFQGLTGLANVSLIGGAADAAVLVADNGQPPLLHADPALSADVTKQARDVLSRIDGLV